MTEYSDSFTQLALDKHAYEKLFASKFGTYDPNESTKDPAKTQPVKYIVDHILESAPDHRKRLLKLFQALSKSEEMSYFRSGYIQRLINYHWQTRTSVQYWIIFVCIVVSYALILTNTVLMNIIEYSDMKYTRARVTIDSVNGVIIIFSQFYLQVRLIIKEKSSYFKQAVNLNEMLFTALFTAQFILDITRLTS
jgi:hypothetical protein